MNRFYAQRPYLHSIGVSVVLLTCKDVNMEVDLLYVQEDL